MSDINTTKPTPLDLQWEKIQTLIAEHGPGTPGWNINFAQQVKDEMFKAMNDYDQTTGEYLGNTETPSIPEEDTISPPEAHGYEGYDLFGFSFSRRFSGHTHRTLEEIGEYWFNEPYSVLEETGGVGVPRFIRCAGAELLENGGRRIILPSWYSALGLDQIHDYTDAEKAYARRNYQRLALVNGLLGESNKPFGEKAAAFFDSDGSAGPFLRNTFVITYGNYPETAFSNFIDFLADENRLKAALYASGRSRLLDYELRSQALPGGYTYELGKAGEDSSVNPWKVEVPDAPHRERVVITPAPGSLEGIERVEEKRRLVEALYSNPANQHLFVRRGDGPTRPPKTSTNVTIHGSARPIIRLSR